VTTTDSRRSTAAACEYSPELIGSIFSSTLTDLRKFSSALSAIRSNGVADFTAARVDASVKAVDGLVANLSGFQSPDTVIDLTVASAQSGMPVNR